MTPSERMIFVAVKAHLLDRKKRMEYNQFTDISPLGQKEIAEELGRVLEVVEFLKKEFE